jgi:hypothetical protein
MSANVQSWKTVLDSRFVTGQVGTWPIGQRDNGTAVFIGSRYLLHATDGYTTVRSPGSLPAIADGRIQVTVRPVGRGNVGVFGRWYSTAGQPNMLACWIRNDGTSGCTNWQSGLPTDLEVRHGGGLRPNADNQLMLQITRNRVQFQINRGTELTLAVPGNARRGTWGAYVSTTLKTAPTQGGYSRITISVPGVLQSVIAAATQTAVRAKQTATAGTRKVATVRAHKTATVRAKQTEAVQAGETVTAVAHATVAAHASLTAIADSTQQIAGQADRAATAQAQETAVATVTQAAEAQSSATAQTLQTAVAKATQVAGVRATEIAIQAQIVLTAQAQVTATVIAAYAQWTALAATPSATVVR